MTPRNRRLLLKKKERFNLKRLIFVVSAPCLVRDSSARPIYRILHKDHPKTGSKWKVRPRAQLLFFFPSFLRCFDFLARPLARIWDACLNYPRHAMSTMHASIDGNLACYELKITLIAKESGLRLVTGLPNVRFRPWPRRRDRGHHPFHLCAV